MSWLVAGLLCFAAMLGAASLSMSNEGLMLRLSDLAHARDLLTSCGDADDLPTNEPLWCSDPTNARCMPAAPSAPHPELWNTALSAFVLPTQLEMPTRWADPMMWRRPVPEREPLLRELDAFERPPRA